jgi:hypothetical protein
MRGQFGIHLFSSMVTFQYALKFYWNLYHGIEDLWTYNTNSLLYFFSGRNLSCWRIIHFGNRGIKCYKMGVFGLLQLRWRKKGGNLGEGERGGEIWIKWEEQRGYTNQMKSITSLCNLIGHVVKHHDLKLFVTFV